MPHPSVVLDTNVIVSAHLKEEGFESFVLNLALAGKLRLFISDEIFEEYQNVLSRPRFKFNPSKIETSLELIEKISKRVLPKAKLKAAKDPDDNKFLECAEEAEADFLVTGNKKHFPKQWKNTRILNAKEFLQEITPDLQR